MRTLPPPARAPALAARRPAPRAPRRRAVPAVASSASDADADYAALKGVTVYRPDDGTAVDLLSTFKAGPGDRTVLVALTHCADLAPQELVPKLVAAAPAWAAAGVQLRMVALGTPANAAALASVTRAPPGTLYADPTAATHAALGLSEGYNPRLPFLDGVKVSPYARLVAMLAGVGSPGTMSEVARGYVGDKAAPQIFASGPFDILGTGYQRPMELATVRLGSMITSLTRWKELAPPDTELLTRLGGAVVLRGRSTVFRHDDQGILRVASVDDLARAAGVEAALPEKGTRTTAQGG